MDFLVNWVFYKQSEGLTPSMPEQGEQKPGKFISVYDIFLLSFPLAALLLGVLLCQAFNLQENL